VVFDIGVGRGEEGGGEEMRGEEKGCEAAKTIRESCKPR
jgi:hypothetical protein